MINPTSQITEDEAGMPCRIIAYGEYPNGQWKLSKRLQEDTPYIREDVVRQAVEQAIEALQFPAIDRAPNEVAIAGLRKLLGDS